MTSVGAHALHDAITLLKTADIAAALSFEAQNGVVDALDARVHQVRPHAGQMATARNLLKLLEGSKNASRQGEIRVQDAYSLRLSVRRSTEPARTRSTMWAAVWTSRSTPLRITR